MSKHGSDYIAERYTRFNEEIYTPPKDRTNLYLGLALGVLFTLCLGVYVLTSVIEILTTPIYGG